MYTLPSALYPLLGSHLCKLQLKQDYIQNIIKVIAQYFINQASLGA